MSNIFSTTKTSLSLGMTLSLSILAGCQQPANPTNATESKPASQPATTATTGKPVIYASTNVWGSIAKEVAKDKVDIVVAVDDPSQDPHEYQATAQDKLNISKANIVLVNGGGYDDWATSLAKSVDNKPIIIDAVAVSGLQPPQEHDEHEHDHEHEHDEKANDKEKHDHDHDEKHEHEHEHEHGHHHHHGDFNEHVFFSLDTAKKVADAVANHLGNTDPSNKAVYAQNAQDFMQKIDGLKTQAQTIGKDKKLTAFATEAVLSYLLKDMNIQDVTPKGYVEQSETDAGVSVKVLDESKKMLSNKQVSVLIVNAQTEDATSKQLTDIAKTANIPVVEVYETFPQGVTTYTDFIQKTLDSFANVK